MIGTDSGEKPIDVENKAKILLEELMISIKILIIALESISPTYAGRITIFTSFKKN